MPRTGSGQASQLETWRQRDEKTVSAFVFLDLRPSCWKGRGRCTLGALGAEGRALTAHARNATCRLVVTDPVLM